MSANSPNIILINCDDLGYGDLGCYGSEKNRTPHIDALARSGTRFTDFYMPSPVCSPSRGGMLTGCYPPRIGFGAFDGKWVLFPGDKSGLDSQEATLASQMSKAGYFTKLIGKWHCGDQPGSLPLDCGFREFFGLPYSNDMGRQTNFQPQKYPPLPLMRNSEVIQQQPDQRALTERYTHEAVCTIRDHRHEKFFLYFAHMHVHVPIFVPKQFLDRSQNGGYGAAVEEIDWSTGVIMKTLEELGLRENTLIIFTSDNGSRCKGEGGSNAPCRGEKATTWEGGIRVPCVMSWPETIPADRTSEALITAMDFLPTFTALAGTTMPDKRIDGIDMSMFLKDPRNTSPRQTFAYYSQNDLNAIRHLDWKLHFSMWGNPMEELYNLKNDPGETTNLYEKHPEIVEELAKLAEPIRADLGDAGLGITGSGCRPCARTESPKTLTTYDPDHPYIIAEYDLADMPTMNG